jgi:hypothetical protein
MLKKLFKSLKNQSIKINQKGSVLAVTLIVMVVLTASVATVTSLTINQSVQTSIKQDAVVDEVQAKRLIQLAISKFEDFIITNEDFDAYENTEIPRALADYDVTVTNVTGTTGFEEFGLTNEGESRAYRFAYTLENEKVIVMYSYVSTTGSTVQAFNPFDFSLGTNGDLILTGGYYRDAAFFAENVYYNYRTPYIFDDSNYQTTPSSSGSYPDFNGNGSQLDVYYRGDYQYCTGYCFDTSGVNDPIVFQRSEFIDIDGSGLETGDFDQDTIISNFFGEFNFAETVINYVSQIGPTGSRTITDSMTLETMNDVVAANASAPGEECISFRWRGQWYEYCYPVESTDAYTDLTNEVNFDPYWYEETLEYSGYYDATQNGGALIVREGLHIDDRDNDSLFINGDMIFDNNGYITIDGTFVITGDLIFQGDEVDIDGAFYVLGEVIFDFNEEEGVSESGGLSEYGFTIMAQDNILVKSMWESDSSSRLPDIFDCFWYTEESIYIDAVNSRLNINGVIFANAKGVSGNYIPVVDEFDNPILGIVINSYRGYINRFGNAVPSNNVNRNAFYMDVVNNVSLQNAFVEVPEFESLVVTDGVYTFETSEFRYE